MVLRMVLASLGARRARMALALIAVALGVGVATALAMLALQVGDDLARTLRSAGPNFVVLPRGARLPAGPREAAVEPAVAGLALPESAAAGLKRSFWKHNILEAAPELALRLEVDGVPAAVVGTWFDHRLATADGGWRTGLPRLRPEWRIAGRWPRAGTRELAAGPRLAERLGLAPGGTVVVGAGAAAERWTVSAVLAAAEPGAPDAWAPLDQAQRLASRPREVDRLWVSALVVPPSSRPPPDPARDPVGYERYSCTPYPANVARDLAELIPAGEVLPMTEVVAGEALVVRRLNVLMVLLALAALTASTLGLLSTTTATVVERGVELGLLRALGAGPGQIAILLMAETLTVSALGGALGWGLGILGAAAIRGQTFGAAGAPPPLLLPLALALALAVAVAGTVGPLRLALRVDPARALRG